MANSNSEYGDLRLPFAPHWHSGGYLRHWNVQHWSTSRPARTVGDACDFVGRVGVLAVTFGIGTAIATGCIACASAVADPGERGSSVGGASVSTSQSVRPVPRAAAATGAAVRESAGARSADTSGSVSPSRGTADRPLAAPAGARSSSDTAERPSTAVGIAAAVPVAVTAPATPDVVPPDVVAPGVVQYGFVPAGATETQRPVAAGKRVPERATAVQMPAPAAQPSSGVAAAAAPAVVIASPPAASVTIEPTFSSVLAALSDAMMDTNTIPADAALAVLLGAARREIRSTVTPQAAATRAAAAATTSTPGVEAERMTLAGTARSVADRGASGGSAIAFSGSGQASATLTLPEQVSLTLRMRTAAGAPNVTLAIDGVPYTTLLVTGTSYSDFIFAGGISPGTHVISISSTTASTRNILYVDSVTTASGPIIDEFLGNSGSAPGRLWTARSGTGFDSGNQTYSASNAFLDGQGHLVIQATRGKKNTYTSGWVWTKNNLSFGYGTVTARVKMPKGQGLWPAVWMMGSDSDTVGWPASGEIDIVELPSTTTTVYSTLHGPIAGTTNTQQAQIVSTLPDLSTDYHNYWVRHMPDQIVFGVDDLTLGTLTPADLSAGETWVYNRPMYMILNLAVGGSWAGAPNSSTAFPAKMLVESVTFAPA